MHSISHLLITIIVFSLLIGINVFAGVNGKVSGYVEDAKTGDPLVGATIKIIGTNLQTKTDEDGEYFIINVPVGKYDIQVTHVGFELYTKKDARVLVDLTTPVDFALKEMVFELSNPVIVYASQPLIKKDLTESRVTFTAERLLELPNTVTIQNVLGNYPGIVVDREAEIHARGGRAGQISFYYDGFNVEDPFLQDVGIRIIPSSLEELSLSSGGFGAEYGNAQSGVVSAITRVGSDKYHGSIRSYEGFTHLYNVENGEWANSLTRLGNRSLAFDVSGPIAGTNGEKYSFFAAGEYLRDNNYLPHDWAISYTGALKLSMQPSNRIKIHTNFTYSDVDADLYEHRDVNGISYDFNLDGLRSLEKRSYLAGISGNYYFNERTILAASINRFSTKRIVAPRHLRGLHYTDWDGYSVDSNGVYNGTIHEENYLGDIDNSDPYQRTGFTTGDDFDPTYSYRETSYNTLSASIVQQVNKSNQIKAGVEYRKYDISNDFRQFYNSIPFAETYETKPSYTIFFLQNKLEYEHLVVNAGLRMDMWSSDLEYNATPTSTFNPTMVKPTTKKRYSPRLGVSFPISENSVMHFNYGIYYQIPSFNYLYFNPTGDINTGRPLLGNPDLSPEQTISYELGLDHVIADEFRVDVTAYIKDINDLVTTRLEQVGVTPITRFSNDDYGSVKGLDISIERLPGNGYVTTALNYGYMIASGNGSDPLEPYYNYGTSDSILPITEYPLNFDQRHTVTATLDWRVPADWKGNLLGMAIPGNWGMSMIGYYGSGLPYTRTNSDGLRVGERNEERLPAFFSVDARFNKNFELRGNQTISFFVEVENIFNRRNIINVYTQTGLPDDDAFSQQQDLVTNQADLDAADRLYDQDPQNYSPPRSIRTGFVLSF